MEVMRENHYRQNGLGEGCASIQIPAGDPVVAMAMKTQPHMCGGGPERCSVEGLKNSVRNIKIKTLSILKVGNTGTFATNQN